MGFRKAQAKTSPKKEKAKERFIQGASMSPEEEKAKKKALKKKKEYPWTGLDPYAAFQKRPDKNDDTPSNWGRSLQVQVNGWQYEKIKYAAKISGKSMKQFVLSASLDEVNRQLEKEVKKRKNVEKIEANL